MSDNEDKSDPSREDSGGSADLRETVEHRPVVPLESGGLGQPSSTPLDVSSDAESVFHSIELFDGLTRGEIREIVSASEQMMLSAGEILFEQNDPANALFIVENGELQVRAASGAGEDIILAMLGSGTVVGEMSLIGGGPRSATVEALSDCQIYRLESDAFAALRAEKSSAAYKIILRLARILGERRRQTDERIEQVFADPANHLDSFESQVHDILARIRKA
ncbi:MAG: cyclic nucleotide-binding domain-containing protein [Myxococcota bacterium]